MMTCRKHHTEMVGNWSAQNFRVWGYVVLLREKRAFMYFFNSGILSMTGKRAESTAFWSVLRSPLISGFAAPSAKNSDSLLPFLAFSRAKYLSSNFFASTFEMSTFVCVPITNLWLTRRNGTPFTFMGPVTRSSPDSSCFKQITRLPRNRPERRIRTAPGFTDSRNFGPFLTTVFLTGVAFAATFAFGAIFCTHNSLAQTLLVQDVS